MLVPSNVPAEIEQAKITLEKIREGKISIHPDYEDETMEKLNLVISGRYPHPSSEAELFRLFSEDLLAKNKKLSEDNKEVYDLVDRSLAELRKAEEIVIERFSASEQIKLARAKVVLLELLANFDRNMQN